MGSLQLECPLCCSETFTCHNSLKYHLLSITDNLICPGCQKRFDRIIDLALHLGRECVDSEPGEADMDAGRVCEVPDEVLIKQENLEGNLERIEVKNSLLAKALMQEVPRSGLTEPTNWEAEKNGPESAAETTGEDEDGEDLYFCSSCAVSFGSIREHLQEFHEGHEVLIEEEECDSDPALIDPPLLAMDGEDQEDDAYDHDGSDIIKTIKAAELINTVQDTDGPLYQRKLVKIEKFWDEKEVKETGSSLGNPSNVEDTPTSINSSANTEDVLEIYQCSKCEGKFATMKHYRKHKCSALEQHNKYKKCKICKACFVSSKYLAAHMKIHKPQTGNVSPDPNPPYVCEICNTEFTTYKSLRLHRRMHEPIKSKDIEPPVTYGMLGEELGAEDSPREMFICQLCNKPYNKEYEEAHKKFHSNEVDFNCNICNRKFFTQENLDMHMRAHSDTKKFICSYCKKGFLTKEKLDGHMTAKCQKRQYECQYCGRRFARPHEKVKHERIHTGEKPHVCEICGKAFRVSYCLTLHMRTHSGTRPYKCDHCGKRFKAHSVYNHHLLTHSDDRKYKCSYCPKTFKTGVQLAGHKNSHTKPFACTECNRPFASLYAVRAHMETHQRQNNLKHGCWMCGASYARAFALRDHIREQHVSEHPYNADTDDIVLEADDYPMTEPNAPILADTDESILIDIGNAAVENMEIPDVQVTADLQSGSDT